MKRTTHLQEKNTEYDKHGHFRQDQEAHRRNRDAAVRQNEKNRLDQEEAPSREDWEGGRSQPQSRPLRSFVAGLVIASLAWSFPASANLIQGEITEVNAASQSLRVARSDPSTLAVEPESILVQVGAETVLKGFTRLEELREGDEVIAEIEEAENPGVWNAESLQVDKVQIRNREMPEVKAGEVTPGMEKL